MVHPDSTNSANLLFSIINGHWISEGIRKVPEFHPGEVFQCRSGIGDIYRGFEFSINRDGMSAINGYANTSAGNLELGFIENLPGFVSHFQLFLRVSVFSEVIDVGN